MVNAGRILILTKGDWSSLVTYEMLDLVSYNGVAYLARQASVGVNPSTDTSKTYWQPFGSVSNIATTSEPGLVMPDGDTIKIESSGLIYVDIDASGIDYDNTQTGITATDVQSAIDTAAVNAQMALDGIGPVETSSTASQGYSKGDFFFYNGKLYVCTLAFAQGAMIIPGTNCQLTTVGAQLKDKLGTSDIANNLTTTTTGKVLDATQGKVLNDTITNKHKVTQFSVSTSGWTTDTSSQSGTTLYKKSVALSHVYVDTPSVDIGATGVLPTTAEQEAYDLLQYATVDGTTLYLYASDIPTTAFYINVEGVD